MKSSCPRCNRPLEPCGEATIDGETFPVFQCEDCIVPMQFGNDTFDAAYTFALRPNGSTFDPSADDLTDLQ